jgi:CRP/FNR family cyclic AMP-dependent transcriptional regulator|tara:strand:- start:72 stop:785 length:714 start_codon:yes stop_codon:yes gene_type:complete
MTDYAGQYDISETIQTSPWFQNIPSQGVEKLVQSAQVKHLAAQQYLYQVGENTTSIYCILSGRLRISITSQSGQEFALNDFAAQYWLGDFALVDEKSRIQEAQVQVAADILVIPRAVVLDVGERYPILYKNLFYDSVHRARKMNELLGGMAFYPLRARLAGRILDLILRHGVKQDRAICLDIKLSQNDFARLCLGSRQRVNKIFREWTEKGILGMQSDRYLIYDTSALQREITAEES